MGAETQRPFHTNHQAMVGDCINHLPHTPPRVIPLITAYEEHGLKIVFNFASSLGGVTSIQLVAKNLTQTTIQNCEFQAAVLKSMKVALEPASSSTIPTGCSITQQLYVTNIAKPPEKILRWNSRSDLWPVAMLWRISYKLTR